MDPEKDRPAVYGELKLSAEQIEMVSLMARLVADRVGYSERVIRGFAWKCLSDWQQEHRKLLAEVSDVPPPTRLEVFREVTESFRSQILRFLPESAVSHLDAALETCSAEYRRIYENR